MEKWLVKYSLGLVHVPLCKTLRLGHCSAISSESIPFCQLKTSFVSIMQIYAYWSAGIRVKNFRSEFGLHLSSQETQLWILMSCDSTVLYDKIVHPYKSLSLLYEMLEQILSRFDLNLSK